MPRIIFCIAALGHHLHHLLRLLELVQQLVHFLHRDAGAGRDAALARRLDELRLARAPRGVIELMMPSMRAILRSSTVAPCAARASSAGSLSIMRREAAHLVHLPDLRLEVLEVEALARLDLLGELLRFLDVDVLLRLLDQRQHVAHAEDARGHALRMERLEAVELLATRRRT